MRNQRIRLRVGGAHFETTIGKRSEIKDQISNNLMSTRSISGSLTTVPSSIPDLLEELYNNNDEEIVFQGDPEAFRVRLLIFFCIQDTVDVG